MRYFSLQEAEALLPKLSEVMGKVKSLKEQAEAKVAVYHKLEKEEGQSVELAICRSQAEFLVSQINSNMDELFKLGCIPKGVDPYLVDFPYMLQGREVNLCWKYGEKRIGHYHDMEGGFSGRKPLPKSSLRHAK